MYPDEKKLFVEIQKVSSKIVYLCGQKKNKMAEHNELGKEGEDEAAHYLTERGYHILHRNWRRGRNELDIVAAKDNQLVIVEVKTRRDEIYGHPEDAITNRKIRTLVSLADSYIKKFKLDLPVQFDIITVVGNEPPFRIEHIEEAFLPPIW